MTAQVTGSQYIGTPGFQEIADALHYTPNQAARVIDIRAREATIKYFQGKGRFSDPFDCSNDALWNAWVAQQQMISRGDLLEKQGEEQLSKLADEAAQSLITAIENPQ